MPKSIGPASFGHAPSPLGPAPSHALGNTVVPATHGNIGGIVPAPGKRNTLAAACPPTCTNLSYHNGPVMHSTRVYTIYWAPSGWSFPSDYATTINTYFQDLAHDNGRPTNVYSTDPQYTDSGGGRADYNVTWGGTTGDTNAYPSSTCIDDRTDTVVCLDQAQMAAEINAVAVAHGWPRDLNTMYFLFTPEGLGSCFDPTDSTQTSCAYNDYCAYHSHADEGGGHTLIWANQPWTAYDPYTGDQWCDVTLQYPNNSTADPTINVVSHEHNEAATDPLVGLQTAWNNTTTGMEDGDQCAWYFGTVYGADGSQYNQVINGNHYLTQLEWDNLTTSCLATTPLRIFSFSPTSGAPGSTVVIRGSGITAASSITFGGHAATSWTYQNGGNQITVTIPCGAVSGKIHIGNVWGSVDTATNFTVTSGGPCGGTKHVVADFNNDGSSDRSVFRPSNGTWYINGLSSVPWGVSTDIPVPADYDNNGSADVAVFRPSNGNWYVKNQFTSQWGVSTDIPVPGDYNGDGKADVAVFRPSNGTWYIKGIATTAWGVAGDIPVPGDYNGDGTTDIAVYRPSNGTWYVKGISTTAWGVSTDIPVPGDYNGDKHTDIAVYRRSNGTWYVKGIATTQYGVSTDKPAPGDYNGDGTTDIAVWRPSNGNWYVKNQTTIQWGVSTDRELLLPNAIARFFP